MILIEFLMHFEMPLRSFFKSSLLPDLLRRFSYLVTETVPIAEDARGLHPTL